jgi:hypothetical protein
MASVAAIREEGSTKAGQYSSVPHYREPQIEGPLTDRPQKPKHACCTDLRGRITSSSES